MADGQQSAGEPRGARVATSRGWVARLSLAVGGLLAGVAVAELALWCLGLPRQYQPRSTPGQFMFVEGLASEGVGYVNAPAHRIRFVYDGNPRGYFAEGNVVDHETNSAGFRVARSVPVRRGEQGQIIFEKPPETEWIAFLGDSFTFGEGVWGQDTYPEQTVRKLRERYAIQPANRLKALNLGVCGYNTQQELDLLEKVGLPSQPDLVVLGYVLNDAEPPLFQRHPESGEPYRVPLEVDAILTPPGPERKLLYPRIARLCWQFQHSREMTRRTTAYYRSLYFGSNQAGWEKSRVALGRIAAVCRERKVPLVVLLFPLLQQLDGGYPYRDVHELVSSVVVGEGAVCIDLLDRLEGLRASQLWVHPTDHHPNEIVHEVAAEALVDAIASHGWLRPAAGQPGAAVRDGAVRDGAVRDGAVRDGAVRDGAVRNGAGRGAAGRGQ